MVEFILYERATGRVMSNRQSSESWAQNYGYYVDETYDMIAGQATETQYVVNRSLVERPTLAQPTAVYDLTQLPAGTTVEVWNEVEDVLVITNLVGTLTLTDPGSYRVKVDPPFPYLPIDTIVKVN